MNALIKLGVPLLVVGLLVFGVALAVVQEWLGADMDPSFTQHPLMMVTLYAGLLMAGLGVLVIVVGEVKRHDEGASIRKSPQRGRPVKPPEGQPASTDPQGEVAAADEDTPASSVTPKRPQKTLSKEEQVAEPTSGAPGEVHQRIAEELSPPEEQKDDDGGPPRT